jgi:hypothetical protein
MFDSDMLEVAIGLVFVYLLFSFLTTGAREALESWAKHRAAYLETGILQLLQEPAGQPAGAAGAAGAAAPPTIDADQAEFSAVEILERLYRSSPIFGLFAGEYAPPPTGGARDARSRTRTLPSYIPPDAFSAGMLEVVGDYAGPAAKSLEALARVQLGVEAVPSGAVRDIVRTSVSACAGDPALVRRRLELWYADAMDRVAGRYRRLSQAIILTGSFVLAVAMNINTITIVQALSQNAPMRAAVSTAAQNVVAGHATDDDNTKFATEISAVGAYGLPMGWDQVDAIRLRKLADVHIAVPLPWVGTRWLLVGWFLVLVGWIMTALAISLGAPFWFDVLNKFMVVRATVKPREKSAAEGSKDAAPADGASPAPTSAAAPPAPAPAAPPGQTVVGHYDAEVAAIDPVLRPREGDV